MTLGFVYDTTIDPSAENNSHAFCLSLIGFNKSVLEVGCATGYFSKVLAERDCDVVGIELDPEMAEVAKKWLDRVVVGDLDGEAVWAEIEDEMFDVVTFGDVLEHLRDPLAALRAAKRKLKPSGYVVASVPNIAHGDVRLSLLKGEFRYRELGLLDQTHIRFFTIETLHELFAEAGLVVVDLMRVMVPLFESELGVQRDEVDAALVEQLQADPEASTYQFVVKAVPDNGSQATHELADRVVQLTDQVHGDSLRLARLSEKLEDLSGVESRSAELVEVNASLMAHIEELGTDILNLHRHIEAQDRQIVGLGAVNDSLNSELNASQASFAAIVNTRSYRVFAPLRRVRKFMRRKGPSIG